MKNDINDYVGIPWLKGGNTHHGVDCWGLATLVLKEVYGIEIKQYNGSKASDEELEKIIDYEKNSLRWVEVPSPVVGTLVAFKMHVGVYIGNDKIIHAIEKINASSQIHHLKTISRILGGYQFYAYNQNFA